MKKNELKKITIVIVIFLFSISLRLWNLNQMGRTWDEPVYVEWGYNIINLVRKGDFSNKYWYANPGFPPVSRYFYGLASIFDINHYDSKGNPVFNYDLTYSRFVSAVLTSLTAIMVVLIGWKYFSPFVGIVGGAIFSMLPLAVAYGQIATLESHILFFFTGTVFWFLNFLSYFSKKNIILTGIFLGIALGVKFTNVLLLPLLFLIFIIWHFSNSKHKVITLKYIKGSICIPIISFFVFLIIWPMPWFHIQEVIKYNYSLRVMLNNYPSIEVFFGRVMHVPIFYYLVFFLITTPVILLILFFLGSKYILDYERRFDELKAIDKRKNLKWVLYTLIIWFCLPFIQSFYNFRQHGIRYIIEIYVPFAIISAIGFDYLINKVTKNVWFKFVFFVFIVIYLFVILSRISPYYLDYYNFVVGGTKNVYEKKLFQLGWWGQGIREAGLYLEKNASSGSRVGLAVDPIESMPKLNKLKLSNYSDSKDYDYVVIGYYRITRLGFDDSKIRNNYNLIYTVNADGARIIKVYKRK